MASRAREISASLPTRRTANALYAVYPYASKTSQVTQQAVVIFVDTEEDGRRRSWQCFYNTADLQLVDPLAVAQQFRTLAGTMAVDSA